MTDQNDREDQPAPRYQPADDSRTPPKGSPEHGGRRAGPRAGQ